MPISIFREIVVDLKFLKEIVEGRHFSVALNPMAEEGLAKETRAVFKRLKDDYATNVPVDQTLLAADDASEFWSANFTVEMIRRGIEHQTLDESLDKLIELILYAIRLDERQEAIGHEATKLLLFLKMAQSLMPCSSVAFAEVMSKDSDVATESIFASAYAKIKEGATLSQGLAASSDGPQASCYWVRPAVINILGASETAGALDEMPGILFTVMQKAVDREDLGSIALYLCGTLLGCRIPILQCLELVAGYFPMEGHVFDSVQQIMIAGGSFSDGFEGVYPQMVVEVIRLGEQRATLDEALIVASEIKQQISLIG